MASKPHRMASVATLTKLAIAGESGRGWYQDARREAERASKLLDTPLWVYADYLALFSPRVSVIRSIRLANYYALTGQFHPTTMRGIRASVEHYEKTAEIRGPKTGPFARALLGAGDAIVLDVWMAVAFRVKQSAFSRKATHAVACGRIRMVARKLGWTPAEVQAAIWTATVRRAGKRPGKLRIVNETLFGPELETAK